MRLKIIGSAAGGGFPQWNCNYRLSRAARKGMPGVRPRTQSSLAASADGRNWVLFNASPDIREQIAATPELQPPPDGPLRATPIAAVVLMTMAAGTRHASTGRLVAHTAYLAVMLGGIIAWVGADVIAARFEADNTVTLGGRFEIWEDTLRIARDFWLTGTGLNTYGVATLFYQTSLPAAHLREAHSDYLQLAAEGGVLLAVPIVLTIVAFAREVRRRVRTSEGSSYWIRVGAVTGIVAIALQSTVEFSLQMPGNAAFFAVLCGLALHEEEQSSLTR